MRNNSRSSDTIIAADHSIKEKNYWKEKLAGELVKSSFGYDYIKLGTGQRKPDTVKFSLSGELFSKLIWIINESDARLQMILVTALVILLHKYSGNTDIIVGTPIYKQDIESDFINTVLTLRNRVEGNVTFKELLFQVKESIVEATENQNYPIKVLLNDLNIPYSQDDFPLFDIVVLLENFQDKSYIQHVNPNLFFSFFRTAEALQGTIEYNSSLYKKETIERIIGHFKRLLKATLFHVDIKVTSISILSEDERKQLLFDFNNTKAGYPEKKTIHEYFTEQVEKRPGNTAAVYEDRHISYRELNKKTDQLASVLRLKGVNRESILGIMVERSLEMLIAILSILKVGCAYLPIATKYPDDRLRYILRDSDSKMLLTHERFFQRIGDICEVLDPGDAGLYENEPGKIDNMNTSKDLAYVIYTSGSTGKPKGVMIEHQQVINLVYGLEEVIYKRFSGALRVALIAPYEFDASVQQIFAALLLGHSLYIVPDDTKLDSVKLLAYYKKYRIIITDCTPTHIRLLLENIRGNTGSLAINYFIIAGEVLPKKIVEDLLNSFETNAPKIINFYGPTETCVDSTYYNISRETLDELDTVPIGRPLPNEQMYILSSESKLQPIGVPGELCIGGDGVARGYVNKEELTSGKFVKNPFIEGNWLYRTGDLTKWLPDGNIEFIGRMDHQVKLRGFRIELGEIECQLLKYEKISEAVVKITEKNGEKALCAYIVSDSDPIISELREYLSADLPEQMIPEYFIKLDKMPLTTNGKLDRKALDSYGTRLGTGIEFVEPGNELEKIIAGIWQDVLKLEKVSVNDSFFEVGGNSLSIVRVNSSLKKAVDRAVPLVEMFRFPTIRSLAQYLEEGETDESQRSPGTDRVEAEKRGKDKLKNLKKRVRDV